MRSIYGSGVIPWSSPVVSFGDVSASRVATLGINPSNREFVNVDGRELRGSERRFHTLNSLGLQSWEEADTRHIQRIWETCSSYFEINPYDTWFKKLDVIIAGIDVSFYNRDKHACHLDLIPYATKKKWAHLTPRQRFTLLSSVGNTLAELLRAAPVEVLILNGQTVVQNFEELLGRKLSKSVMPSWTLKRQGASDVPGIAYVGAIDELSGVILDRNVLVLGYNHNLQSSYGVTSNVLSAIREWITTRVETEEW
jgi:hypothetical protein